MHGGGHSADLLADLIVEGVDDLGYLGIGLGHLQQVTHIGAAGISHQTAAAHEHLAQLLFGILAGEAQLHHGVGGQGAGALGGEGTLTVQGVLGIHNIALNMGTHGHAAAHMAHDQIQILVLLTHFLGVALGDGLLVQGVELADTGDQGMAGIAGNGLHLVHHGGIRDKGGHAQLVADLPGDKAAQIAGVLTLHTGHAVGQQGIGGGVGAATNGLYKAAPGADGGELLHVKVVFGQGLLHQLLAPLLLVGNGGKLCDLLGGMTQGFVKEQGVVFKHADLGRGGAGINNKNVVGHDCFLLDI